MLRTRQKLGKYRIEGRISDGQYASIYKAYDTIQGIRVALKVPHEDAMDEFFLQDFRREARLARRLEHENILPIRDASFIDGRFVIVMPLGVQSLADRMRRRISTESALKLTDQALAAAAKAHESKVIHCDIKPENFILFPDGRLKLSDFGFSKIAQRAMQASGSGTVGYIAPEQAVGRPMFQSDVFSLGLMIYELFTGHLPSWPYAWPPPKAQRVRARFGASYVSWLRKAMAVRPEGRFKSAVSMYREFRRLKRPASRGARRTRREPSDDPHAWARVLFRQFLRKYRRELPTPNRCPSCTGPIAQEMMACPWCGVTLKAQTLEKDFPAECPRCGRGSKLDWPYCAWCYGSGFEVESNRHYSDKRYTARCEHADCRGELMPFMRYCPWCRRKVARPWRLGRSRDRCPSCRWGVDFDYWHYCPWCKSSLDQ